MIRTGIKLLMFLIIAGIPLSAGATTKYQKLFSIENNLTRSRVIYSIRLNENYKIVRKNPVYNFWLRKSGSTRPVKWYERKGYGIRYQEVSSPSSMKMSLIPYRELLITILIKDRKALPYITQANKNLILLKIQVVAEKGVFGPRTKQVIIHAKDPATNRVVTHRIK